MNRRYGVPRWCNTNSGTALPVSLLSHAPVHLASIREGCSDQAVHPVDPYERALPDESGALSIGSSN